MNLNLQGAVQMAMIGRYYERIGDHAVNIGERVMYMVTGWLPEKSGAARQRLRESEAEQSATSADLSGPEPSCSASSRRVGHRPGPRRRTTNEPVRTRGIALGLRPTGPRLMTGGLR